jgi:hypothetical protein
MRPRPQREQGWRKGGEYFLKTGFLQSKFFSIPYERISLNRNPKKLCGEILVIRNASKKTRYPMDRLHAGAEKTKNRFFM